MVGGGKGKDETKADSIIYCYWPMGKGIDKMPKDQSGIMACYVDRSVRYGPLSGAAGSTPA